VTAATAAATTLAVSFSYFSILQKENQQNQHHFTPPQSSQIYNLILH
jgi:hypothetical protein